MESNTTINKVIYGGRTLIDLTADTVTEDKLLKDYTAHDKSGAAITGTCTYDVDSTDATAAVAEILAGKTAYARGAKLTGTLKIPSKTSDLQNDSGFTTLALDETLTDNTKAAPAGVVGVLKKEKVGKSEIGYGGIKSVAYIPLFGGEFSVTTETEEGYIKPHALASVTGRISKHYVYRVTVNGTKYELPCDLYCFAPPDGGFKCYEYLGNLSLYVEDVSGVTHDIRNVPFLIISDLDNAQSIDVFTNESITTSILVEQIQKNKTEIPKSLFFGDDYYPFEFKRNEGTFNGTSIGINSLHNSRGTVAIGYANVVNNDFSQAFGFASTASGKLAQAFGYETIASGLFSHSEGYDTEASGDTSHAEGKYTEASGAYSHAEGYESIASLNGSHAEGVFTTASNKYSHAEGYKSIASGVASHAEGNKSEASGGGSHAEGQRCISAGTLSHSGGTDSESQGTASFAHGIYVKATQNSQFVVGYGNEPQEDSIFEVGNGLDENGLPVATTRAEPMMRQNAFRVTKSGIAIAQKGLQIGGTIVDEELLKKIIEKATANNK